MDVCNGETEPVVAAALQATVDLLIASKASLGTADRLEVTAVADKWLQYVPGCTIDNDYCGSPWAARVRNHPTRPYLDEVFGCHAGPGAAPAAGRGLLGLLVLAGLLVWRRIDRRWM